jgi:Ca-activated chloride channel family protein
MLRLSRLAPIVALASAIDVASPAQRIEQPVITIKTDLVTLPVTVVDRRGALVTGLRAEHFTVYDDGEPQAIQLFTSDELPATIGLVVDSSASMRGRREHVTAAAAAFVAMHRPLDEFFTLNFNEVVWPGLPPSVVFSDDCDQLLAALSAVPSQGMTAVYDAIERGLGQLERGSRDRRALILVSDGGDNASAATLATVLEHARRTNAVIYSVTFFDPDNRDARPDILKALARETGGRTLTPRRAEQVTRAFARIAEEIRKGYTIGFVPAETSAGGFRTIRVVADRGDGRQLIARTRAGYYASPPRETVR